VHNICRTRQEQNKQEQSKPMPPVKYIERTRETYDKLGYPPYRWFHAQSAPAFTPVTKPLAMSRLGMISTAGTYLQGQVAYYYKDDTSIRAIPKDAPTDKIRFSHITENYLVEARQDSGTVFPLESLSRLEEEGFIGELASEYYSCMGGIYSQNRVVQELIPNLEAVILEQDLDLLLLVPL
jgi:D-proline reductase (dithiol) PrdB